MGEGGDSKTLLSASVADSAVVLGGVATKEEGEPGMAAKYGAYAGTGDGGMAMGMAMGIP